MNNYTSEQLLEHGDFILEFVRSGGTLKIEFQPVSNMWEKTEEPLFNPAYEYREALQPLYTNSIGEDFYFEDQYYRYDLEQGEICDCVVRCNIEHYPGIENGYTDMFKTKSGALIAAAKYYADKGE